MFELEKVFRLLLFGKSPRAVRAVLARTGVAFSDFAVVSSTFQSVADSTSLSLTGSARRRAVGPRVPFRPHWFAYRVAVARCPRWRLSVLVVWSSSVLAAEITAIMRAFGPKRPWCLLGLFRRKIFQNPIRFKWFEHAQSLIVPGFLIDIKSVRVGCDDQIWNNSTFWFNFQLKSPVKPIVVVKYTESKSKYFKFFSVFELIYIIHTL